MDKKISLNACRILGLLCAGLVIASAARPAEHHAALIAQARQLAGTVGESVWTGLGGGPFGVLLISGDVETLYCRDGAAAGFQRSLDDPLTGCATWIRPRQYQPDLLASFPLSDGIPTIVAGTPETTGREPLDWVVTLLHEHLHQLQYSSPGYYPGIAALDLAGGDQSGMWMLNYSFPYHDPEVGEAFAGLGTLANSALAAVESGHREDMIPAIRKYLEQRGRARSLVSEADWRYVELQLWQEGVARWLEHALAVAASQEQGDQASDWRKLADHKRARIGAELDSLSLSGRQRVVFYPLGAAEAMMLEATYRGWPGVYWTSPFDLGSLLSAVVANP